MSQELSRWIAWEEMIRGRSTSRDSGRLAPGAPPAVPAFPEEGERPTNGEADESADASCLDNHPDEIEQPASRIEPPNASHDEQPILRAPRQRGEDPAGDGQAGGEVIAAAAIVGLGTPRPGSKEAHRMDVGRAVARTTKCTGRWRMLPDGADDVDERASRRRLFLDGTRERSGGAGHAAAREEGRGDRWPKGGRISWRIERHGDRRDGWPGWPPPGRNRRSGWRMVGGT